MTNCRLFLEDDKVMLEFRAEVSGKLTIMPMNTQEAETLGVSLIRMSKRATSENKNQGEFNV